ncbi:hypothetical protein KKD80_03805 [Patescibacteria group bacterium]|nr:hypothetical protein [Patescibacteria group bacterium]
MTLRLPYCIIISLILIVGLLGNFFLWESPLIGLTFGPAYLIFYGFLLGFILFRGRPDLFKFIYGLLFFIAGLSLFGALIYFFYKLNPLALGTLVLLPPFVLLPFLRFGNHPESEKHFNPLQINPHILRTTLLLAAFIFLTVLNVRYLLAGGTVEAIRSPWKILPFDFFLTYFAATLVLLYFVLKSQKEGLNLILISAHTFVTVALALFVYRIGYGFDPFIHQATEKIILTQGFILPKPFYYLGQYSLVVFLAKIFHTSVVWVDRLLLPTLISVFLPATIYFSLRPFTERNKTPGASLAALFIFLLPFTSFLVTTPQGLANFFLLIIIFFGILVLRREFSLAALWFLGFVTLLTHPLAGIPALIFLLLLTVFTFFKKQQGIFEFVRHVVFIMSTILAAVAIPLVFLATLFLLRGPASIISLKTIAGAGNLLGALGWSMSIWVNHFRPLYDLVYTYGEIIPFILLAVGLAGYSLFKKTLPTVLVYLTAFSALITNYALLKLFVDFPSLIKYEQGIYPGRVLEISFYFLIPLFLFALYKFFEKLMEGKSRGLKFFFILIFSVFLTFSLYYSYPKDDGEDYPIDRGYSVSIFDLNTVHKIDEDAAGADYVVLANQSVSAAAIREFGFNKYYGPYFYYPIPTGDPLYQYYLDMVYQTPSRATVAEAANLTGAKTVYFVLNKYWTDSDKILESARPTADETIEIGNGKIWIFKYQLK